MASSRCSYQLLSAIEHYLEEEKNVPDGVKDALGTVSTSLHGAVGKSDESSKDDGDSFAGAKEKSREKYSAMNKSEGDSKESEDKQEDE